MNCTKDTLIPTTITIVACLVILPTTLLYLGGLFVFISFLSANTIEFSREYLGITALLLVSGYSLYSLWWLLLKYRKIYPQRIPKFIRGGIFIGVLLALIIVSPYFINWLFASSHSASHISNILTMLMAGGAPLAVAIAVIICHWRKINDDR